MKNPIYLIALAALLTACSAPPKAPQPTGDWVPVNKPVIARE